MSKARLELGGGNWAAKDGKLLGYAVGDTSSKYLPREFTFSRGADIAATRVNKDGLVEKYRENKAHYSNNFATVSGGGGWGHSGINTISTGQDGYDGTTNATFIRAETTLSKHQVTLGVAQSLPGEDFSITGVFTLSVYAKPNGYDHLILRSDITNINASFNIATGVVGTRGSKCISSSMTYAGNGFYRCQATFNHSGSVEFLAIGMMEQDDTTDFTGDTSKGYILQDAQLEMGLSATDLISTNGAPGKAGVLDNLPRIDYTSGSPRFIMEPQRTNKLPHSEYFGLWGSNGVNLELGYEAPDGTKSAYKISVSGGTAETYVVESGSVLPTDSRSIWAKTVSGTGTVNLLTYYQNTNNLFEITNEWQRFEVSSVTTNTGETNFYAVDFRGDGTLTEVLIWGAQAEVGSYATSYIPTHGVSVTRNGDIPSLTGASDLIGQEQGTIVIDFKRTFKNDNYNRYLVVDDNDSSIYRTGIFILPEPSNDGRLYINLRNNSTSVFDHTYNDTTDRDLKIAVAYSSGDIDYFVNGVKVNSSTATFSFSHTLERISVNGSNQENNQILVFKTKLTDSECIALTTL